MTIGPPVLWISRLEEETTLSIAASDLSTGRIHKEENGTGRASESWCSKSGLPRLAKFLSRTLSHNCKLDLSLSGPTNHSARLLLC
jgi:hypothetical protein